MKLKSKLSLGLVFLFLIIFTLVFLEIFYIEKLAKDADNILKNNFNSLKYTDKMSSRLDQLYASFRIAQDNSGNTPDLRLNRDSLKAEFARYLALEKGNITETGEKEQVVELITVYGKFMKTAESTDIKADYNKELIPLYLQTQNCISSITQLNMKAIEHKNMISLIDYRNIKIKIAMVGSFCIILAFAYFWYFPFYVSYTNSMLADKMQTLLKAKGISINYHSTDENYILLESINYLNDKVLLINMEAKE